MELDFSFMLSSAIRMAHNKYIEDNDEGTIYCFNVQRHSRPEYFSHNSFKLYYLSSKKSES
ncbi:MAG: hypothetical protein BroJett017_03150 [Ignavibacteriota bacterium]|nr:MAG: hypothetical protein BroJett017_03150 [Ignavibacteriota bacterium]